MMRLPEFRYVAPRTAREAVDALAAGDAMLLAGGTDVLPNMKRRQQVPRTLVGLRQIPELRRIANGDGLQLGAGLTLTQIVRDEGIRDQYTALWQAASQVATPHLRNMGTLGGNICLDTRCNYYDQNYEWRKAIDFCMKKDGRTCWVATSSPKCLAVSSTDTAPALGALGATVTLLSSDGERELPLLELYQNDGIHYLTRRADELLTRVALPSSDGWRSTYWKLRRRGSFDFPVLSVAAAARVSPDGTVVDARIVFGAVASRPVAAPAAADVLKGRPLDDDAIAEAAEAASTVARPMDNTDFTLHWRKRVARDFVGYALRELRGDDMRAVRLRIARQVL
ncbi:MAG TPA: FAD binding domain-containing protein [Vicinamibacterales bacterium]|nr:FAD binding domain-containing protein [Vicinamibacterales bacterium]